MTLAIAFKSAEGLVLAADSRVTLQYQIPGQGGGATQVSSAHFDHAIKLLKVTDQPIAAVTYGTGAIGQQSPRTAHSYMAEFGAAINQGKRLTTLAFATELGNFFAKQWADAKMPATGVQDMSFLVGGFDEGEPYGRIFELKIPSASAPKELNQGKFGLSMGGQTETAGRMFGRPDAAFVQELDKTLKLKPDDVAKAVTAAGRSAGPQIPYQFLPLQDCVDLSILLIKTTAELMKYTAGLRGVGGAIDVATITRTEGYQDVQFKQIKGERI